MATYKLLQDIEAEDHILGPLTLRQFIFALVAVFFIWLCFLSVTKHFPFMLAIFAPMALFCLFFALPLGREQPTEVWALAKLRFLFKPRARIWSQSGVKDLVTINVPKKVEPVLTKGYSQNEVKSRLKALATTIDSRGWAIKNVDIFGPPLAAGMGGDGSDRLVSFGSMPRAVPADDNRANDIMDTSSSPIAQQFDDMITESAQNHRHELMAKLNDIREERGQPVASDDGDSWFMMRPHQREAAAPRPSTKAAANLPTVNDDASLVRQLKSRNRPTPYGHLRTMQPLSAAGQPDEAADSGGQAAPAPVTTPSDPAILSLANNNDLNVATLAREAEKAKQDGKEPPQDEVVISLH